jgi:hypothetical protein
MSQTDGKEFQVDVSENLVAFDPNHVIVYARRFMLAVEPARSAMATSLTVPEAVNRHTGGAGAYYRGRS